VFETRRKFITFLAGTATAWPLRVSAQQRAAPVVGFLGPGLDARRHWLAAFRAGLGAEGFMDGQNVTLEYRSADSGAFAEFAADLVRREVAVIFASGPPAALAAKRATPTIPIVFLSGADPVHMGLVSSFNQPGGNITGFYFPVTELPAKRLALLHELLPMAKRIAVLVNPADTATAEPTVLGVGPAGHALSLDIEVFNASTSAEIDSAFATLSKWRPDALLVGGDPLFNTSRAQLVILAARYAFPAIYFQRGFVEAGGLMSYGPDYADSYRQAGLYVGRILKGAKPAELPVQQSTKLELVINLKTAKELGLEVPPNLLARADKTIE
jgi:putative ABC transport system substrate-binding protein